VRCDFTMATAIEAVAQTVQLYGLPDSITIDRDHRFVGTNTARDCPSPFLRFWLCPPHGVSWADWERVLVARQQEASYGLEELRSPASNSQIAAAEQPTRDPSSAWVSPSALRRARSHALKRDG
jgi:hypothetical protein